MTEQTENTTGNSTETPAVESEVKAPALSETLEAFKKDGTRLASTASRLVGQLTEALEKKSGSNKAEIDAIKKQASEKLAADFMIAMSALSDEVEAAQSFDESDAALQSMARGLELVNKEFVKTVEKHGLKDAAEGKAQDAVSATDRNAASSTGDTPASETPDVLNKLLKKKTAPKRPSLSALDPFKDIGPVSRQIEALLAEHADEDWDALSKSDDMDVKAVVAIKEGLESAVGRFERIQTRKDRNNPRLEEDKQKAKDFGASKIAKDFIEVADNMDRALKAAPDDQLGQNEAFTKIYRGVEEARDKLIAAFEGNGITKEVPEGEKFDPNKHEAVAPIPNSGKEKNTILSVETAGYSINGRPLRAPKCTVAI